MKKVCTKKGIRKASASRKIARKARKTPRRRSSSREKRGVQFLDKRYGSLMKELSKT